MKIIRVTTVPMSLKILLKGQLRYMSENGIEIIGVASWGLELEDVRQDEGVRVVAVEMTRRITPLKDFLSLWKMYLLFKKEKPDIVHSHTPKAGIIAMFGAMMARVPVRMHTVAGLPLLETTGLKKIILKIIEKLTYSCSTRVYPNSRKLYELLIKENFAKKEKFAIIAQGSSNGIDLHYFNPNAIEEESLLGIKKSLGITKDTFVFIFIGRLVKDKGLNELITAFSEFRNKNLKLVLVGQQEPDLDPLSAKTLEYIQKNNRIVSVGFQKDVRPYLAISNCLVLPSYREGFPNVVLQAGAMNLPSIVSDINGCNEIIIEGRNGIIIEPKNVISLFRAMKKMKENPIWYAELRANSRGLIRERYNQQTIWEELFVEYKSVIQKNKGMWRELK